MLLIGSCLIIVSCMSYGMVSLLVSLKPSEIPKPTQPIFDFPVVPTQSSQNDCGIEIHRGMSKGTLNGFLIQGHKTGICYDQGVTDLSVTNSTFLSDGINDSTSTFIKEIKKVADPVSWAYIAVVGGSLLSGGFPSKEACYGHRDVLKEDQHVNGKCVDVAQDPVGSSSSIGSYVTTAIPYGGGGGMTTPQHQCYIQNNITYCY